MICGVHSVTEHTSQIVQTKHIYGPKCWYFPAPCQDTLVHHKDLTCHNMLSFPHCPGSDLLPYWIPISLGSDCMPHLPLSIDPCPTTCPSIAEVSYMRVLFASTLTSSRYVIRMQKCNRTNLGKSPSKLFFPQYFLLSTVNLQCCVNLCCTACGLVMHVYDVLVF